jgi:hypothetical protein
VTGFELKRVRGALVRCEQLIFLGCSCYLFLRFLISTITKKENKTYEETDQYNYDGRFGGFCRNLDGG